jgi:F-type H+-transporting ATPase subunit b
VIRLAFLLAEHGSEHGSVPALLSPDWGLVFWTACTFAVVLFILKKTAWGPIIESLERREKAISDQIAAAQHDRAEAAKVLEEHKKALAKVRNEAQDILNEAAADQKRMLDEAHAKAVAEAEATKQRAIRDIELAKGKAVDELKQKTVELALGLAEKVIGSEVDRTKQKKLVDDFIKSYDRN